MSVDKLSHSAFIIGFIQNQISNGFNFRLCIGNSCTVEDWQMDEKLVRLAERLSEYYLERMGELECIDEYNEMTYGRPVSYPGL